MAKLEIFIEVDGDHSKTEIKNRTLENLSSDRKDVSKAVELLSDKKYRKDLLRVSELLSAMALGLKGYAED